MAEQAQDEEFDMDFFYSGKVKPPNQDEPILNLPSPDHKVLEVMMAVTLLSSPPELYDPSMVSLTIEIHLDWVVLPCRNRRNPCQILRPVCLFSHLLEFTSTS